MDSELCQNIVYPPVDFLPKAIRFVDGFRDDVVAFVHRDQGSVVLTNLPVDRIPAELVALCENIAEKALLAYVIAIEKSTEYAHVDYAVARMRSLAREFAANFMRPLELPETTQVILATDVAAWYRWHNLYGWGRTIRNPPGTEYA